MFLFSVSANEKGGLTYPFVTREAEAIPPENLADQTV
jgi:hypothetical protein